jgi:hypothetical protein
MLCLIMSDVMNSQYSLQVIPKLPWCKIVDCHDTIYGCPEDLSVWDGDRVVGCKSSCLAYDTDEYCCRGAYYNLDSCKNSPSAQFFKRHCSRYHSYPLDTDSCVYSCRNDGYGVQFG